MAPEYITITAINQFIKNMFDSNTYLKKVYLKGEISNFKHHTSGHLYLTLKDDDSRISAIMFRSAASSLTFVPEDGMNVLVTGRISVYPNGGNYQIYIDKMEQDGLGNLYIEFEKLKKKLQAEGLFDPNHKKTLPKFPTKIGIVTAPTGAAIKDILSTIKRRFPLCKTILFPALVQGVSAANDIAKKIKMADSYNLDVLIVGRGGGSIEDLWAFNEEIVARAIYNAQTPIISAVGHEIDFTIADYVADRRAPTPTGAAEMAVPTTDEVASLFASKQSEITHLFHAKIERSKHALDSLKKHYILKNPMVLYEMKIQRLDTMTEDIYKAIQRFIERKTNSLKEIKNSYILQNPNILYKEQTSTLDTLKINLDKSIQTILKENNQKIQNIIQTVKLVNPLNILDKGYSVIYKENTIIKSIHEVNVKDNLSVRLSEGKMKVEVKEIMNERNYI